MRVQLNPAGLSFLDWLEAYNAPTAVSEETTSPLDLALLAQLLGEWLVPSAEALPKWRPKHRKGPVHGAFGRLMRNKKADKTAEKEVVEQTQQQHKQLTPEEIADLKKKREIYEEIREAMSTPIQRSLGSGKTGTAPRAQRGRIGDSLLDFLKSERGSFSTKPLWSVGAGLGAGAAMGLEDWIIENALREELRRRFIRSLVEGPVYE